MAATMEEQSPLLERIGNVLLNGLFGLGLIARDQKGKASGLRQGSTSFGALSFVLATVIEAGQMLAFPFSASQTVWRDTVIGNAAGPVLTVVMPASLDVWFGPMAYRVRWTVQGRAGVPGAWVAQARARDVAAFETPG